MRLLLLSNSTNYQSGYLDHALGHIRDFLGDGVKQVLFVPYAGVTVPWDAFTKKVRGRFAEIDFELESVHTAPDPVAAVRQAEAIAVGGGNTFHLLHQMIEHKLVTAIRKRVLAGVPYMGWSAGSNVAGPTIKTTNDMPIVRPRTFDALALVPFQINPHYTDGVIPQHQGETRADRLAEFIEANPDVDVVGLREGSILRVEDGHMALLGDKEMLLFRKGREVRHFAPGEPIDFLLA